MRIINCKYLQVSVWRCDPGPVNADPAIFISRHYKSTVAFDRMIFRVHRLILSACIFWLHWWYGDSLGFKFCVSEIMMSKWDLHIKGGLVQKKTMSVQSESRQELSEWIQLTVTVDFAVLLLVLLLVLYKSVFQRPGLYKFEGANRLVHGSRRVTFFTQGSHTWLE